MTQGIDERPRAALSVDVVVVAYRSLSQLRGCVEPLCGEAGINVIVVDNACPERSTDSLAGLPVHVVEMGRNAGFGAGCNAGARAGSGDAILFLNPDARMSADEARRLAAAFAADPRCGAAGPHILELDGSTQLSMRRLPTLRSAFGEALFLHHVLPIAGWTTEIVRTGYDAPREAEWLSGAVLCVRRAAFEEVGGFDERLFLYCEDIDLCLRLRRGGWTLRYEPGATASHAGGASLPRPHLAAVKAEARVIYSMLHERGLRRAGFRLAYALYELARLPLAAARSRKHLRARLAALRVILTGRHAERSPAR